MAWSGQRSSSSSERPAYLIYLCMYLLEAKRTKRFPPLRPYPITSAWCTHFYYKINHQFKNRFWKLQIYLLFHGRFTGPPSQTINKQLQNLMHILDFTVLSTCRIYMYIMQMICKPCDRSAFSSPLCLCWNFNSIYFFLSPRQRFSGNRKKVLGVCILEKAGQGKKAFEPHTYLKWKMHQILPDATWFFKKKDQLNHKLIINFLKTTIKFIFYPPFFGDEKKKHTYLF